MSLLPERLTAPLPRSVAPRLPSRRLEAIDLWRGLACLAVVVFHAAGNYLGPNLHSSVRFLNSFAFYGYLGVQVFFVISGYCLAEAIEGRAQRGAGGPLEFWRDRFLRIFPTYWAALALALVLAAFATLFNGQPLSTHIKPGASYWLANLGLATKWTGVYSPLEVSWSLDYEIGFYLLVGLALIAPRGGPFPRLACYSLITICAHLPQSTAWFPLLSHWPAFAAGIAVRLAFGRELPAGLRAGLALYPVLPLALAPSVTTAATALFAFALLGCLAAGPRLPAPPRYLLHLGVASYSIYLVHIPFMGPVANLSRRFISPDSAAYLLVWWGQIALGLAAGLLFHRLVESPLERLRLRLRPRLLARA